MCSQALREVPQLSMIKYVQGDDSEKSKFVDELMYGLKEYGFIILKDHLVDHSKINKAYDIVHEFFGLSADSKKKYYDKSFKGQRGFTPFGLEHAKGNNNPDLKEFWHVGRELSENSLFKDIYPDNIWPKEVPEFEVIFKEIFNSLDQTADVLLSAIGRGLGIEQDFFKDMVFDGNSILRLINYPAVEGHDTQNSIRAAAHEDINLITLLVGATNSGLELLDRDGSWLKVKTDPGQIVVDTGDMMQRLTNGILPATTHRVVNPDKSNSARYSMPFFVHPHSNASLACLDTCIGEGKKYEDILAGEFLLERLREIGLS